MTDTLHIDATGCPVFARISTEDGGLHGRSMKLDLPRLGGAVLTFDVRREHEFEVTGDIEAKITRIRGRKHGRFVSFGWSKAAMLRNSGKGRIVIRDTSGRFARTVINVRVGEGRFELVDARPPRGKNPRVRPGVKVVTFSSIAQAVGLDTLPRAA